MKGMNIYLRLVVACLLLGLGMEQVIGQTAHTLNTAGETISGDKLVTLNGNITLTGTIVIPSNAKLTIQGEGTITTRTSTSDVISFDVQGTGQLVVKGTDNQDNRIIFDGGNTGLVGNTDVDNPEEPYKSAFDKDANNNVTAKVSGFEKAGIVIKVRDKGKLTLENVLAKNLYSRSNAGSFIDVVDLDDTNTTADNVNSSETDRSLVNLNNVEITNCLSIGGSGVILANGTLVHTTINMYNCNIEYCATLISYGGIIKGSGKTDCNLNMYNCTMNYCWGSGWGGAILWASNYNGCRAYLEKCTFEENYVRYLGGAISIEATLDLKDCTVQNNTAGYGGGGIAAFPFTLEDVEGSSDTAVGLNLLSGNTISGNKTLGTTETFDPSTTISGAVTSLPSGGGGIWVLMNKDKWNCEIDVSASNVISGNTSAYHGGGVFLYKTTAAKDDTKMSLSATISDNSALSGGGIAVGSNTSEFPSVTMNGGDISGNKALNGNGGGVYMPGGSFTINGGSITGNFARATTANSHYHGNGGGISISNGSFTLGEKASFTISNNEADRYGGGLYVSEASQEVVFDGGTITDNSALAGGGVAMEGKDASSYTKLTLNANVENNTATNGGGVYLNNYVQMTYTGGLLRNNRANDTKAQGLTGNTAKAGHANTVYGVGGGIFMDDNTTLRFGTTGQSLGLYGNSATNAADDIFANGTNTNVTLPTVGGDSGMKLDGFSVPASTLYWAEDFYSDGHVGDENYNSLGSTETSFTDPNHNLRYQYALNNLKREHIVTVDAGTFQDEYVCVTLGYQIYFVTIQKSGLKKNESALFNISSQKSNVVSPYITLLLTGNGDDTVSMKVALPDGKWRVDEVSNWSWSYNNNSGPLSEYVEINDNTVFEFTNTKRDSGLPLHGEDIKANDMGIGGK